MTLVHSELVEGKTEIWRVFFLSIAGLGFNEVSDLTPFHCHTVHNESCRNLFVCEWRGERKGIEGKCLEDISQQE